jgi:3-hydroxyacyl-[acyl-carrier-protein] dehydratase
MAVAAGATDQNLLQHVKAMIRRDLKLGPDAAIADDMPFFGADVDLDSLDMLLLVTSIEKEFGIKVPSEAVGREVFQNVGTLAAYIQANRKPVASTVVGQASVAPANPLDRLPHGEPFRFVTKITEHKPGESATGVWAVTGSEAFFAGHFPGQPLVPGVLLAEALAQISGIAGPSTGSAGEQGKLVHVDVRFDAPVAPPADVVLSSKVTRVMGPLQQFDVSASVSGTVIARGSITLHRS